MDGMVQDLEEVAYGERRRNRVDSYVKSTASHINERSFSEDEPRIANVEQVVHLDENELISVD